MYFFFNDEDKVKTYVLFKLLPEDQDKVYNDPDWGMSTITGLAKWAAASGQSW